MYYKIVDVILIIVIIIENIQAITSDSNQTAEILWNLSNLAVQSRQNFGSNPYYQNYRPPTNQYGLLQYPAVNYPQFNYGSNINQIYRPYYQRPILNRESFLEALDSVARNDDLQCVPKLLCEITSGTLSQSRQYGIGLPFNVNMESFIGLLSAINGAGSSPILHFGKAALLGYTSKGNTGSCSHSYPMCPSDPDRLIQYLNNHNGGFFRFFNGINPQHQYQPYKTYRYRQAEERIQNKPIEYYDSVKFPRENKNGKGLKFPLDTEVYNYKEQPFRKPKELPYDIYKYYNDELDIQKPLPNHQAAVMIFPDRTGTGNLRLDPEELRDDNKHYYYNNYPFSFENNNIRFNPDLNNEGFYYTNFNNDNSLEQNGNTRNGKRLFSFPVE